PFRLDECAAHARSDFSGCAASDQNRVAAEIAGITIFRWQSHISNCEIIQLSSMLTRFLVTCLKRTFALILLICVGCSAHSSHDLSQKVERQLRFTYKLPASVKVTMSPMHSSDFPSYDALTVTFEDEGRKQNYDFLLSKDQKTLIRLTKMDLSQDPFAQVMKKIDVKGRPVRGNANAKVVVVNYDDFECPHCSAVHQLLFP